MEAKEDGIFISYEDIERSAKIAGYLGLTLFTVRVVYCLLLPPRE